MAHTVIVSIICLGRSAGNFIAHLDISPNRTWNYIILFTCNQFWILVYGTVSDIIDLLVVLSCVFT
jgi:hypothetical protein